MNKATKRVLVIALVSGILLSGTVAVLAAGALDLTWFTIDSGGVTWSHGGGFTLGASAGQPDAGVMEGGEFTLTGGFWSPSGMVLHYLPIVPAER
jgi:hypothetical protein